MIKRYEWHEMELTILGASPSIETPGGASSGYLVTEGTTRLLVDCGHGVVGKLGEVVKPTELTAIIISHMHPDHFFDLVPLAYAHLFIAGASHPPLYLPPGGHEVLRRLQAAVDLSESFFADIFQVQEYDPGAAIQIDGLRVDLTPARHFTPTFAMRFIGRDSGSLVYSSDTGWSETVIDLMRGASLALIEATLLQYSSDHEAQGHLTAELAGKMGLEAGVDCLVLTHCWQPMRDDLIREASRAFKGPISLGRSLDRYSV